MTKLIKLLPVFGRNVVQDFLPPISFLIFNKFFPLKTAIILSILLIFFEVFYFKIIRMEKMSSLFFFSTIFIVLFSLTDIFINNILFMKYEGSMSNFLKGFYLLWTLRNGGKSIIFDFAIRYGMISEIVAEKKRTVRNFEILTLLWVLYFWTKSVVYLYLAISGESLQKIVFIRLIFGNLAFYLMLLFSVAFYKFFLRNLADDTQKAN